MIRKMEMERFTAISARPFDELVSAIKTSIGNPNTAEFWKSIQEAQSAAELDAAVQRVLGRTGLMLFVEFAHGMIVRKGTQRHSPRISFLDLNDMFVSPIRYCPYDSSGTRAVVACRD
jgi:hypothetical protein